MKDLQESFRHHLNKQNRRMPVSISYLIIVVNVMIGDIFLSEFDFENKKLQRSLKSSGTSQQST